MKTNRISNRTLAAIATPALIAGAMLVPGTASASDLNCSTHALGGQLANGVALFGPSIPVSIPAGANVSITGSHSDSHTGRSTEWPQPAERYVVQFLDAGGSVIANSWASADLADDVDAASWSGSLGSLTLPADAVAIRAAHGGGDPHTANSFTLGNAGICWSMPVVETPPTTEAPVEEEPTPTTAPETDDTGETTTTTAPETDAAAPAPAPTPEPEAPVAEPEPAPAAPTAAPKADPAPKAAPDTEVAGETVARDDLPETGSETLVFAGIGSLMMAAGRGLMRVSRKVS